MGIPPKTQLPFTAGDALKFKFQVRDKAPDAPPEDTGTPRDLTGWSVFSQVRQEKTASRVEATWEITNGLGPDGFVEMYIPGPNTQHWSQFTSLVSDVQLIDLNGDPETVLEINITAAQDVTRSV